MPMKSMRLSVVLILAAAAPAVAAPDSVYTKHDYDRCPAAKSSEPEAITVRTCSGPNKTTVTWTADSDSSALSFGRAPVVEDLDIGSFFEAGTTIEWRSDADGRPFAAIVRYKVGKSVGALKESRLVVYRLEPGGRSCIMGDVVEPQANAEARALADGLAAGFACGKTKRVSR